MKQDQKKTLLFRKGDLSPKAFRISGEIIRNGGLVVFPTETVYGLGANALDRFAAESIYRAKGRPSDNPLIVHVAEIAELEDLVLEIPEAAKILFQHFSPGPLTLILPKKVSVPDSVTGGLSTVAVRIPSHPEALEFLKQCGVPVAAPSANRSGRPSPTSFEMARAEMEGLADAILDGGDCEIGLESTVAVIEGKNIRILRPGAVTAEMMLSVLPAGYTVKHPSENQPGKPLSPRMKYTHYKPDADVFMAESVGIENLPGRFPGKKIGLIALDHPDHSGIPESLQIRFHSRTAYARFFFKSLTELESRGAEIIVAETVEETGIGKALMNRMRKASGGNKVI